MNAIPSIQSFEEFEATTIALLTPPFRSRFGALMWHERNRPRRRLKYLVEDWLTTTGISFIGGRSGCGKSFLALHMGFCIARGLDFFGLAVRRCGVIYQAGEGGLGLIDRMKAYEKHFQMLETDDIPFVLMPGKIDIFTKDKKDVDDFIAEVKHYSAMMEIPAGVIFIDTLAKATPGIDEISGKDNAIVLENVARIEAGTGCHVCLVHHTNAEGKKLRGHTSLRDNVDQVILIEHDKTTGIRDAVLDKIKDGEDGKKVRFTLAQVPVRVDKRDDGTDKEITSCVVLTVTEKERLKKEEARLGFGPNLTERKILTTMFTAMDRHGKFIAGGVSEEPAAALGKTAVKWDYYLNIALEQMPEIEDRKKAADAIRRDFKRGKEGLIKFGILGLESPWMWWAGRPVRGFRRTFPDGRDPNVPDEPQPLSPGMQDTLDYGETIF